MVTPRSNPKVQDGGTLNGPTGFGSDGYSSVALPLVAVGKQVGWRIAPDDFRVFVPRAASGRSIALEVFSPDVNRNDYANGRDRRTYYGDELYGKTAKLTTNFSFKNPTGQTLADRTFGESLKHTYERLYQANLEPGFYPFTALADGNGKNSFALRVTGGARVEASQFTVTARGQFNQDQVVGFVQIDPSQLGKTVKLENYDADGNQEIVLTLVAPDGKRIALTASGDVQWATNAFVINQGLVGTWKVLARILPTTRQFSNSFAFRVRVNDQPLFAQIPGFGIQTPPVLPLQCEVVDPSGASITGASCTVSGGATRTLRPILPECFTPVSASILEGVGVVVSSDRVEVTSPSGRVRFVAECPQAKVQVNAVALVCGQRSPLSNISFNVNNKFVPNSSAPATVTVEPGATTITGVTVAGATSQPVTVTAVRGQTASVTLEYTVSTNLSLTPENVNLTVGQTATLVATASTAFPNPVPVTINLTLPAGLEATGPVKRSGSISSGKPLTLSVPVKATAAVTNANVRTTLEPNCGVQALSSVTVTQPVTPPAPPTPPPAPDPAKLELTKTVDRDLLKPGEQPVFTVTAKNVGGSTATAVHLTDALPVGLVGDPLDQTFDLAAGQTRSFKLTAKLTDDATGVIVNTARLEGNGQSLTATAQVRVQPVIDLKITKAVTPNNVQIGNAASYTMVVTNNGPSLATGVKLSDPLPEGLTYVSSTASQGTASFTGVTVTANLGTLAKGASATVTVNVTATRAGRFVNTASVAAVETETTLENNRASAALEVMAAPPAARGKLSVTASALTCAQTTSLSNAGFTVDGQRYVAPTTLELAPGSYTVQPDVLPGGTAQAVTVNVTANGTTNADLVYNVVTALSLEPATVSMTAGETRTLTATASTLFPYPVPASISLVIPTGFTTTAPLTKTGTVSSGQPLSLEVPVRALSSVTGAIVTASLSPSCNVTASSTITVNPSALPDQRRESQVVLLAKLADVPVQGRALILSDRIPAGSSYISGSSRLLDSPSFDINTPTAAAGQAIADPYVAADRLFWVLPLKANTLAARRQALTDAAKRGFLTLSRNAQGQTVYGITYRLAHTGALVMPADRVAAIVAIPGARSADGNRNDARIDPNSAMGKILGLGDLRVLQGDPSILEALNLAIPFQGDASSATNAARPQGGPAISLKVSVERPTTDSLDRPTLLVEAFDKDGLPANDEFVTVELSVDPVDPDAQPGIPGYQVALENGVGRVRLQNLSGGVSGQSTPPVTEVRVEARVTNANGTISSSNNFKVGASSSSVNAPDPLQPGTAATVGVDRPVVAVGTLGVGGNYNLGTGEFSLDAGLRFVLRGSVAPGVNLTVGINWQATVLPNFALSGDLLPPANPFDRFPLTGDSSQLGSDIRSTEGLYVKVESGQSYALFGQFNPGYTGVLSSYNVGYNGLQAVIRDNGFSINAFATDAPNANQLFRKQTDGTDIYFLSSGVAPSSERVTILVQDRTTGTKLGETTLTRGADYTIDYATGIVRLRQGIPSTDVNGNPQFIQIQFATSTPTRDFRAGAQVKIGNPNDGFSLSATALQFRNGQFGGNSSLLFGAGVAFRSGGFQAGLEGALSGPFGNQGLGLAAQVNYNTPGFGVRADYQDRMPGFINPETNQAQTGRSLTIGALIGNSNGFSFRLNSEYVESYTPANTGSFGLSGEARNDFGGGFTVGLGLAYKQLFPGTVNQLWATAGVEIPLGFARLTAQEFVPISLNTYGSTLLGLEVPLTTNFSLRLSDKLTYEWNGVRQEIAFGVTGAFSNNELLRTATGNAALIPGDFGQTNVFATYELDTVNGDAGRARVGIATNIPLSEQLSLQLGADALLNPSATEPRASGFLGLQYSDDGFKGLTRAQLSFLPQGLKQVYTAGFIAQLSNEFVFSPTIEYAIDPSQTGAVKDGGTFSIAAAYRGWNWSVLTNNTGKFGLYSTGQDRIEGEIQFGYQTSETFYLRGGFAYRLPLGSDLLTFQVSLGFTDFITDWLGFGAQGAVLYQPSTGGVRYAFGVDGSVKIVDNLLFTAGVNFLGFGNGINGNFAPGLFFRFDWKIDERTFGWR